MTSDLSLLSPKQLLEAAVIMKETLESFTATEPCDCGCPNQTKVVLFKPVVYYATANDALNRVWKLAGDDAVEDRT